jgi:uncharacterized alkaline shock family protein YloU
MTGWVPFAIDNSPEFALDGFLYEGTKVEAASSREASESGDNEGRIESRIMEKVPHYPFDLIPLIKPDMLVNFDEKTLDEDISIGVLYYTKSTFDEAFEFYKQTLQNHERFNVDEFDSSTGKTYNISFSAETADGYKIDAGVMVMEMPENTGYTCAVNVQCAIRGIAKEEVEDVGLRDDGLPENFPDNIVPANKMTEIYMAEGDSQGCYVQFDTSASYEKTVDFYRNQLNDKTDFYESNDVEGEVSFYCLAPGWEINVRIMDSDGHGYVEINCYAQ